MDHHEQKYFRSTVHYYCFNYRSSSIYNGLIRCGRTLERKPYSSRNENIIKVIEPGSGRSVDTHFDSDGLIFLFHTRKSRMFITHRHSQTSASTLSLSNVENECNLDLVSIEDSQTFYANLFCTEKVSSIFVDPEISPRKYRFRIIPLDRFDFSQTDRVREITKIEISAPWLSYADNDGIVNLNFGEYMNVEITCTFPREQMREISFSVVYHFSDKSDISILPQKCTYFIDLNNVISDRPQAITNIPVFSDGLSDSLLGGQSRFHNTDSHIWSLFEKHRMNIFTPRDTAPSQSEIYKHGPGVRIGNIADGFDPEVFDISREIFYFGISDMRAQIRYNGETWKEKDSVRRSDTNSVGSLLNYVSPSTR